MVSLGLQKNLLVKICAVDGGLTDSKENEDQHAFEVFFLFLLWRVSESRNPLLVTFLFLDSLFPVTLS